MNRMNGRRAVFRILSQPGVVEIQSLLLCTDGSHQLDTIHRMEVGEARAFRDQLTTAIICAEVAGNLEDEPKAGETPKANKD